MFLSPYYIRVFVKSIDTCIFFLKSWTSPAVNRSAPAGPTWAINKIPVPLLCAAGCTAKTKARNTPPVPKLWNPLRSTPVPPQPGTEERHRYFSNKRGLIKVARYRNKQKNGGEKEQRGQAAEHCLIGTAYANGDSIPDVVCSCFVPPRLGLSQSSAD